MNDDSGEYVFGKERSETNGTKWMNENEWEIFHKKTADNQQNKGILEWV